MMFTEAQEKSTRKAGAAEMGRTEAVWGKKLGNEIGRKKF